MSSTPAEKVSREANRLMLLVDDLSFDGCDDVAEVVLDAANLMREAADIARRVERNDTHA